MTEKDLKNEILIISGAHPEKCMRCGKCSGACPSFENMEYHPHQFADMVLSGRAGALIASESLFKCLSCFVCAERCPRDVLPSNIAAAALSLKERVIGGDRLTPDGANGKIDIDAPQQLYMAAFRKYGK